MHYNINDYQVKLDSLGKIIIYLRKSREDLIDGRYASDEETLARHEAQLQQWATSALGHAIPADCIYKEVGSGEKIKTRPVFQEVLKRLETDKDIDGVLVVNCSRLSRGDLVDCGNLINILELTNTIVLTPQKIYNLKNKYDKRFFKDELLRGNDYLEQTKELLGNGRHWSTAQGKYLGSVPPFGYDRVTCKEMGVSDLKGYTLRPNENAEYIKLIFEMYADGAGAFKIASYLQEICAPLITDKEWDYCKINRILETITYNGYVTHGKYKKIERIVDGEVVEVRRIEKKPPTYKGLHEAIIPPELWDKVQSRLQTNFAPVKRSLEIQNPFASLIFCAVCGRAVTRRVSGRICRKRKYELDVDGLQKYLRTSIANKGMSIAEFARTLGKSKSTVSGWLNDSRFKASNKFTDYWQDVKRILDIDGGEYEAQLFEYVEEKRADRLCCNGHKCSNISANLDRIEKLLYDKLVDKLKDYNYFIDNYAEEITKTANKSRKSADNIDKLIAQKEKQLKNARIAFEKEVDTLEEYIERKQELNAELKELNERKNAIAETLETDNTVVIKKAVPLLENVIADYFTMTAGEKNELLKTLISEFTYLRTSAAKGADITLEICWLI